jgi:hypothetical protein
MGGQLNSIERVDYMGTMCLFVILLGVIIMAGDRGGRPYKYFLLDKLYELIHNNNAVTPCKSMTYASEKCPPPPSKFFAKLPQNAKKV